MCVHIGACMCAHEGPCIHVSVWEASGLHVSPHPRCLPLTSLLSFPLSLSPLSSWRLVRSVATCSTQHSPSLLLSPSPSPLSLGLSVSLSVFLFSILPFCFPSSLYLSFHKKNLSLCFKDQTIKDAYSLRPLKILIPLI